MSTYIPIKEIISLELDVTEEINNKNLKDFVLTSLSLNNKIVKNDDLVYVNYIKELKQYQILVIESKYKYAYFQVFEIFYSEKNLSFDLYLCSDFFCLYKNGTFYYYQLIEFATSLEEILEFINKKFNTKIDNYKEIESKYLDELKNRYLLECKASSITNINIKKNHSFKFFIFYLIVLFSFCIDYYLNSSLNSDKNLVVDNERFKFEEFKKKHNFYPLTNDFDDFFGNIKNYNLDLESFEYKQNKTKMVLISNIKENLYLFLNEYKKELISSSISFNENNKNYEVVAYVKLFK